MAQQGALRRLGGNNNRQRASGGEKIEPRKEGRTGHDGFVKDWELADVAVVRT